ncbi:ankyrin repeat-containing domain protein [Terfezia claveryi]|nr:ankyrin repeat-containing domain protein [Terfezia claveryi]
MLAWAWACWKTVLLLVGTARTARSSHGTVPVPYSVANMPFISFPYFKSRKASSKAPELGYPLPPGTTTAKHDQQSPARPRSTSGLLRLPPEILIMISDHLTRYRDLNSLILTHPRLASILSSVLYRRALSPSGCGGPFLLLTAVTARVHSLLQLLLTSYGVDPNETLATGWREQTPLHTAVSISDVTSARILLEAGINVNATDSTATTALHIASWSGNAEMISLLASHGANLEAVDNESRTPLNGALSSGSRNRVAAVSALLGFGASPNTLVRVSCFPGRPWMRGWSSLHLAALDYLDPQTMIRLLVEHGADLEQSLPNIHPPCTPLALVAEYLVWIRLGDPDVAVELLLELGADIEPALLAIKPRPDLATMADVSVNNALAERQTSRFRHMEIERMWEAESENVKKDLLRATARVKRKEKFSSSDILWQGRDANVENCAGRKVSRGAQVLKSCLGLLK